MPSLTSTTDGRSFRGDERSDPDATSRVALVTGGSRGIGRAVCLELARRGHPVAVNYATRADAAEEVVAEIEEMGGKAMAVGADVADEDQVTEMFDAVAEGLGQVAVLVNNAGINRDNLLLRMPTEDFDAVIATNLRSAYLCTKAALRSMLRARWGRVICMASVAEAGGGPGQLRTQGGPHQVRQDRRQGGRFPGHHRQRDRPRLHRDRHDRRPERRYPAASLQAVAPAASAGREVAALAGFLPPRKPRT